MSVHAWMALVGRVCVDVSRYHHVIGPEREVTPGPVQFDWSDGGSTTIEAGSDWALEMSDGPWRDPFVAVSDADRKVLADEIGIWELDPQERRSLAVVVGHEVSRVGLVRDEVGETVGADLEFGSDLVRMRIVKGELGMECVRKD